MDKETEQKDRLTYLLGMIAGQINATPELVEPFARVINEALETLNSRGHFGRLGDLDPRGDMRKGEWTAWNLEVFPSKKH